jgi:hypothetical protein
MANCEEARASQPEEQGEDLEQEYTLGKKAKGAS